MSQRDKPLQAHDVIDVLTDMAPLRHAEPWDNVGLLVGDRHQTVSKVLLTIDCTAAVVEEARAGGCQFIVSYHPPIFKPVSRLLVPHPAALA